MSDRNGSLPPSERWSDVDELRWAARKWAVRIDVALTSVHIRPMRTKWASISIAGRLTLNSELLARPRDQGEYAIVHELVHLLSPDPRHGRLFRVYLRAYLPDWERRHESLVGRPPVLVRRSARISRRAKPDAAVGGQIS